MNSSIQGILAFVQLSLRSCLLDFLLSLILLPTSIFQLFLHPSLYQFHYWNSLKEIQPNFHNSDNQQQ